MKNYIIAGLCLSLFGACVVPINTGFESARMLKKGEPEFMGHYTYNSSTDEGETDGVNHNFGLRLGYGLTNRVGLKARYVRLIPLEEGASGVNYVDLAPKFALWPDRIAATVPFGLYFSDDESEFVISPKLLFTYPAGNRFEATIATKADIFPDAEDVYLGLNLGFGFSSNLNRWAVRPEIGLLANPEESGVAWAWGIGFNTILPGRNDGARR